MNELLQVTKLLYCSWFLSGENDDERTTFPTGPGLLDRALKKVVDNGEFPDWLRKQLHFVRGNLGLACEELPLIQKLATSAKLTADPNPSYTTTEIVVGEMFANRSLAKMNISRKDAEIWGRALRNAVNEAAEMTV